MRVEQTPIPETNPQKATARAPEGKNPVSFLSLLTQKQQPEAEEQEASPEEWALLAAAMQAPAGIALPEQRTAQEPEPVQAVFSTVEQAAVENLTTALPAKAGPPESTAEAAILPETASSDWKPEQAQEPELPPAAVRIEKNPSPQSEPKEAAPREPAREPERNEPEVRAETGGQPLFREMAVMPRRVGNAAPETTRPPELTEQLKLPLRTALRRGESRVEVQLNPEHLGKVTVELHRDGENGLHILLRPESREAGVLLREHSHELGALLESSRREPVQVEVRPQEPDRQAPQEDGRGRHNQQQEQQRRQQPRSGEDFLRQLRLGLVNAG